MGGGEQETLCCAVTPISPWQKSQDSGMTGETACPTEPASAVCVGGTGIQPVGTFATDCYGFCTPKKACSAPAVREPAAAPAVDASLVLTGDSQPRAYRTRSALRKSDWALNRRFLNASAVH